jgi:hypothetical protein
MLMIRRCAITCAVSFCVAAAALHRLPCNPDYEFAINSNHSEIGLPKNELLILADARRTGTIERIHKSLILAASQDHGSWPGLCKSFVNVANLRSTSSRQPGTIVASLVVCSGPCLRSHISRPLFVTLGASLCFHVHYREPQPVADACVV